MSQTIQLNRQLRRLGLVQRQINGDGNCLFRAYSDQMLGHDGDHTIYRLQAALYVEENAQDFKEFIPGGEKGFKRRLRRMREDAVFGDHIELMALARQDNVIICVHQLNFPPVERIYPTLGGLEPPAGTRQIHLGYINGDHYNSVREIGDDSADPTSIDLDAVGVIGRILSPLRIEVPDEDCLFFNPTTADYTKIPAQRSSNSSSTNSFRISSEYSIGSYEITSAVSEEDEVPSPDPSEIELDSVEESDRMASSDDYLHQPPYRCWRCAWYYPDSTTFYKWYIGVSKKCAIEAAREHLERLIKASIDEGGGCTDGELLKAEFVFNPEEAKSIPLLEAWTPKEAYNIKARCRRQLGATGSSANYYSSKKLNWTNDEIVRAFNSDHELAPHVKERPEWHILPHKHNLQVSSARPRRKNIRIPPDSELSPGSLKAVLWNRKRISKNRYECNLGNPESRQKQSETSKKYYLKKRSEMSEEQKLEKNRSRREHRLENPDATQKDKERNRKYYLNKRSEMSEEQKLEKNMSRREQLLENPDATQKDKEYKKKHYLKKRSEMSEEQKLEKNRSIREHRWENSDAAQKHNESSKKYYLKKRSEMSEEQKLEKNKSRRERRLKNPDAIQKDKEYKKKYYLKKRSEMSEEQKLEKNRSRREHRLKNPDAIQKDKERNRKYYLKKRS